MWVSPLLLFCFGIASDSYESLLESIWSCHDQHALQSDGGGNTSSSDKAVGQTKQIVENHETTSNSDVLYMSVGGLPVML